MGLAPVFRDKIVLCDNSRHPLPHPTPRSPIFVLLSDSFFTPRPLPLPPNTSIPPSHPLSIHGSYHPGAVARPQQSSVQATVQTLLCQSLHGLFSGENSSLARGNWCAAKFISDCHRCEFKVAFLGKHDIKEQLAIKGITCTRLETWRLLITLRLSIDGYF